MWHSVAMGLERTRAYLLSLPFVEETLQWDHFVYWVMDKAVGGKMFAVLVPEQGERHVMSFAVPLDRFNDLLETEGVIPAPYLARAHWVALERWDVFTERELHEHMKAAYERVEAKLPTRVQRTLEMKPAEYRRYVRERRALLKAAEKPKK
jgi:predicted DNA-binding protein (MmcQ/YjbR family)